VKPLTMGYRNAMWNFPNQKEMWLGKFWLLSDYNQNKWNEHG